MTVKKIRIVQWNCRYLTNILPDVIGKFENKWIIFTRQQNYLNPQQSDTTTYFCAMTEKTTKNAEWHL